MAMKQWWEAYPKGAQFDQPDGTTLEIGDKGPFLVDSQAARKQLAPIPPQEAKDVESMQVAAGAAGQMANRVNDFAIRNEQTPTGGLLGLPFAARLAKNSPAFAKLLGVQDPDNLAMMDSDSLEAASAKTKALTARPSQMEFGKFIGAVPTVQNAAGENRQFQQKANAANVMAQAQASFFQSWADKRRTTTGALPAWLAFQQQHFDTAGNYYHDPSTNPDLGIKPSANAALATMSQQAKAAPAAATMYDINGQPVSPVSP